MAFCESLAQRSPQRLSVARAPSITESISASSWTRGVTRPSCSPTRKTSCPAPCPFSMPRSTRPGVQSATPIRDMTRPIDRFAPAIPATIGSGQQFCAETTAPAGPAWRRASWVAHAVSYDLHGDERELEVPGQPRGLVEMDGAGAGVERIVRAVDGEAVPPDRLHLLSPRIDQGDVVAGSREEWRRDSSRSLPRRRTAVASSWVPPRRFTRPRETSSGLRLAPAVAIGPRQVARV